VSGDEAAIVDTMLVSRTWSLSAVAFASACAFNSGGVPGSDGGGASIGSNDTTGTTGDDPDSNPSASASTTNGSGTTATTEPDPDSGMTADPSTTSTTQPADDTGDESTGPMIAETGDDDGNGRLDSAPPLDTDETMGSTGPMTEDSGAVVPPNAPYYGNCDDQSDCGDGGECFTTAVQDGPDAHVCLIPCGVDCPDPENGTAVALCTTSEWCVLSCEQDEDCPTGMSCYVFNSGMQSEFRRCLWSQG